MQLHLHYCFFHMAGIGNVVLPTPRQIFIGFVDSILRSKVLGSRQQWIISLIYAFQTSPFNCGKIIILIQAINFIIKSLRKRIEILAKCLFSFPIKVFNTKLLLGENFGSPHTSNQVYLLRGYFSNYLYLKDMYIILKGTGKILYALELRILLICKFLNFTAPSLKKLNFQKFTTNLFRQIHFLFS